MSDQPKKSFSAELRRAAWFKWIVLIVSIFLIITGSMLIYESQYDHLDQNTGLLVVSSLMLILCLLALLCSTYVGRKYEISIKYLYIVILAVIFGVCVGVVGLVNAVDVPNSPSRTDLGYVFGSFAVVMGILATFWSCIALWLAYTEYYHPFWSRVFMLDDDVVGINLSKKDDDFDQYGEIRREELGKRQLSDIQS